MSGKPKDRRLFVKVLVDFVDHEKTIEAIDEGGGDAGWLWLKAVSWSRRRLTDGFLSHAVVRDLARFSKSKPEKLSRALVVSGLWEDTDGGYRIHDFAEFAPTKEEVTQRRADKAESMRILREQRRNTSGKLTNVTGNMVATSLEHEREIEPCSVDVATMFVPVTEVSEVSDPPNPPASHPNHTPVESARRDGSASPGSVGPTEAELVRAYVRGVESATGGTFGRRLDAEDRAQLAYIWDRCVCDNPSEIAKEFLGRLTALVAEWVAAKNNPKDRRYQSGWAVRRFVAWVQERHDGAQDAPERASVVSPWGDPTPDEMASLRGSQGAA